MASRLPHLQSSLPSREHQKREEQQIALLVNQLGDIQARLAAEKVLAEVTLASVADGVVVTDPLGHITFLNRRAEVLGGMTNRNGLGRRFVDVFKFVDKALDPVKQALLGAVTYDSACAIVRDGEMRCLHISAAPVWGEDGEVSRIVVVFSDVTAEREAQQRMREMEERWSYALESLGSGVWDWDISTGMVAHNRKWCELLALEGHFLQHSIEKYAELLHPDDRERVMNAIRCCLAGDEGYESEHRMLRADGQVIWVRDRGRVTAQSADGVASRMTGAVEDITLRKQAEEHLRQAATVFEKSGEGIIVTNEKTEIISINPAFSRITGYQLEDVRGKPTRIFSSGQHDAAFYQNMWETIEREGHWEGEIWNRRRNGNIYPEWLSVSLVRDEQGKTVNYIGIFSDISQRKEAERNIWKLAHHDHLTGLANRFLLNERIQQELRRMNRNPSSLVLMLLDLDRFKQINDTLGHRIGDELLIELAGRLRGLVREDDTVCRLGGDEFVLLLTDCDGEGAIGVAEKVLGQISTPFHLTGHELMVTGSLGVALYPQDGASLEALMMSADLAMYAAKHAGRNAFRFYSREMEQRSISYQEMEHLIKTALDGDGFELYFQPQIALRDRRLVGVEALVRLRGENHRLIPPDEFIRIAEESGQIVPLGEWVMRTALIQMRRWLDTGMEPFRIAVNVSAVQFNQANFCARLCELVEDSGVPPSLLELELTETVMMKTPEASRRILEQIDACGVRLSVDDFGTGYSSLSYLKQFRLQQLKIDRSFVEDIETDEGNRKIVKSIIALADSLGLETIAEGVESVAQLEELRALGCELVQGYYFAEPLPADRLEAWLDAWGNCALTGGGEVGDGGEG